MPLPESCRWSPGPSQGPEAPNGAQNEPGPRVSHRSTCQGGGFHRWQGRLGRGERTGPISEPWRTVPGTPQLALPASSQAHSLSMLLNKDEVKMRCWVCAGQGAWSMLAQGARPAPGLPVYQAPRAPGFLDHRHSGTLPWPQGLVLPLPVVCSCPHNDHLGWLEHSEVLHNSQVSLRPFQNKLSPTEDIPEPPPLCMPQPHPEVPAPRAAVVPTPLCWCPGISLHPGPFMSHRRGLSLLSSSSLLA